MACWVECQDPAFLPQLSELHDKNGKMGKLPNQPIPLRFGIQKQASVALRDQPRSPRQSESRPLP